MSFDVENFIEQMVIRLGYELVDLEIINHGQLLRVFIDKPDLVNIDDCVLVSNQLNHALSVEEEFNYDRLEVSSPGVDRVIKKLEDFDRFNGEKVKIKTRSAIVDRKNFSGILRGIRGNNILLEFEESIVEIDHDNLDRARLDPVL
ncbi:ribosome maturation factor RimP [Methylophilaceae bacterium]|nr:ribosome maturation factor RimP [Methylophilaceae bacterium]